MELIERDSQGLVSENRKTGQNKTFHLTPQPEQSMVSVWELYVVSFFFLSLWHSPKPESNFPHKTDNSSLNRNPFEKMKSRTHE